MGPTVKLLDAFWKQSYASLSSEVGQEFYPDLLLFEETVLSSNAKR